MNVHSIVVGPVSTNCYIVNDDAGRAAVIDPGDNAPKILAWIRENALSVEKIFLTHGHFDHIMAVAPLKEATGAEVVIAAGDAEKLLDPARSLASRVGLRPTSIRPDRLAGDGDVFSVGALCFTVLLTPGHTPGSAVLLCERTMFSGDTLFEGDCGRCDLPGGSYPEMLRSLRRLYALEGDYTVYPGHDVSTTLDRERRFNQNMLEAIQGSP